MVRSKELDSLEGMQCLWKTRKNAVLST